MSIQEIVDNKALYFYPPPPGEPDPESKYDGETPRNRIARSANKTNACCFVVMKWLTPFVGKKYESNFELTAEAQEILVKRNISLNNVYTTFEERMNVRLKLMEAYQLPRIYKKDAQSIIDTKCSKLNSENREFANTNLTKFLKERLSANFLNYIFKRYYNSCVDCEINFLFEQYSPKGEKNDPEVMETMYRSIIGSQLPKPWNQFNLIEKSESLCIMSMRTCAFALGFISSNWNPYKNVKALTNEIRTHGPMMVQGYLGKIFYVDKPFKLKDKIGGRSIYGWLRNATKLEEIKIIHTVLVVGARSDTQTGHVYFVDPRDATDPVDPDSTPVYIISYPTFQQAVVTMEGEKIDKGKSPEAPSFGWHGSFRNYI